MQRPPRNIHVNRGNRDLDFVDGRQAIGAAARSLAPRVWSGAFLKAASALAFQASVAPPEACWPTGPTPYSGTEAKRTRLCRTGD